MSSNLHNFSIDQFKKSQEGMAAINNLTDEIIKRWGLLMGKTDYTIDGIKSAINGSDILEKINLSRAFFRSHNIYKRIIIHYATLLNWVGILIPVVKNDEKLSKEAKKKYNQCLSFLENTNLPTKMAEISVQVLTDGGYYGLIQPNKEKLIMLSLPYEYCRSRFVDYFGNNLIDFNVAYFDSLSTTDGLRERIINSYPKYIIKHYQNYSKGKVDKWVKIPNGEGVYFPFLDGKPPFLGALLSLEQLDGATDLEITRAADEIRKIIVQQIPHLNDGTLLFEPDEAEVIHNGSVQMMKSNPNVTVLTTYADISSIVSKATSDRSSDVLSSFSQNVYDNAGASRQLFSATGNMAMDASIKNDICFMMLLANRYSMFLTTLLNINFKDSKTTFNYQFLPISIFNSSTYITDSFKLAQSGYSYLLPALALGLTQRQFTSLKSLENDVLKLGDKLIPLGSAYTASKPQTSSNDDDKKEIGAQEKPDEEKSEKTIQNIESQ